MVLVDAMANNLKNPPFPFENEIKTHFRLKANSIRAQLDRWKQEDDGRPTNRDNFGLVHAGGPLSSSSSSSGASSSQTPFDIAAKHLRELLDELDPPAEVKDVVSAKAGGKAKAKAKAKPKAASKATRSSSRLKAKK